MDNDTFLYGLVAAARAVQTAVLLAPFVAAFAFLALACVLLFKRHWIAAGVCVVLAATPLLVARQAEAMAGHQQVLERIRVRQQLEARARQVAAFERTALNGDYPPILEVHGSLGAIFVRRLMAEGLFTEVRVYERYRNLPYIRTVYTRSPDPACRRLGLEGVRREDLDFRQEKTLKACFPDEDQRLIDVTETPPDAVVFKLDGETTLGPRSGHYHGRLELRVRRGGEDRLVDYWEAPYVVSRPRTFGAPAVREPVPEMDEFEFVRRGVVGKAPAGAR